MNENKFLKKLEAFNFFQIEVIADFEYEGKIYKNHKQYNNDSILNSNNWELHKETFFNQRMNFYKESYTLSEKIKLEIETLENLTINETDYKILKDRYNSFLSNKQNPPQQDKNIKTDEVIKEFKDFFIPDVKIETINNIQTNYKDLIGKKMAFLIYLLETEFKIINYSLNGKNDSRKHFVKSLKSIDTKMQGINKHFEANSTNLSIHKFENDNDYKKIKDFLTKTI